MYKHPPSNWTRYIPHQSSLFTYRITCPPIGDDRSILIHTHHLLHVIKAWVIGNYIIERRLVLIYDSIGYASPANFPQNQTKGIDVHFTEGLEHSHVDPKCNGSEGMQLLKINSKVSK